MAANSVISEVRNLGAVVCFGVAGSGAIITGKTLGANRLKEAEVYAGRLVRLSLITAALGAMVILICRPIVLAYMDLTPQARSYLSIMLLIAAYYIFGMAFNTMAICGIFRSGGDVRFGLILDAIAMWGYAVLGRYHLRFCAENTAAVGYFVLCLDEFVKMPLVIRHYQKREWIFNITR